MKKILLAFDGPNFSEGAFEFARKLNTIRPVLLTGVFVPISEYASLWSYADGLSGTNFIPSLEKKATKYVHSNYVHSNIKRFESLCQHNNIAYKVHRDFYDFALPALKKESRFADLLIVSSEKFYANLNQTASNENLVDILHEAECPVLVVPEKFRFPENNILAYDGTGSSVYAIKQFAYLFPELCQHNTLLVYSEDKNSDPVPDYQHIDELTKQHYLNLTFINLEVDAGKYFQLWARENPAAIVICGSYARSFISRMLKRSFIADVIAAHQLPVFIAHQ